MRTRTRKGVLGAFGVVGAGLMLSSTAFACTIYLGKVTASGNGAGNLTQTVVGKGTGLNGNTGMTWCGELSTPTVKVASGSASISLATLPTPQNKTCKRGQMRDSTLDPTFYRVGVTPPGQGHMPQGGGTGTQHNCHQDMSPTAPPPNNVVVDTGEVNAAGVFTSATTGTNVVNYNTTTFPTLGGAGPNSICIYYSQGPDAIAINMDTI